MAKLTQCLELKKLEKKANQSYVIFAFATIYTLE